MGADYVLRRISNAIQVSVGGMKLCGFIVSTLGMRGFIAVALSLISGVTSAVALAWLGRHLASNTVLPTNQLAWLTGCILASLACDHLAKREFIALSARAIWNLRRDLARQILQRPYDQLERIGSARLMAALTDDVTKSAQVLVGLPTVLIALAMSAGCFVSLAWISPGLLTVACAIAVPIVLAGLLINRQAGRCIRDATFARDATFEEFRSLTEGLKELKLHTARREAFLTEQLEPTLLATQNQITAARQWHQISASGSQAGIFILLLGVLISASWYPANPLVLTTFAVILLYIKSAVQSILMWLPAWSEASAAIGSLSKLGFNLAPSPVVPPVVTPLIETCRDIQLALSGVSFHYTADNGFARPESFSLGPIDLTLRSGEVVFIIGGNGSGKTTMMKLLIGLYAPDGGSIRLNGVPVTDANREAYRQLFSVVFADFHLFERLLGATAENLESQSLEYLKQLQLHQHVTLSEGRLSTTRLSHGQRQRLALLTAYLEDRPVYVFDEWAANQDPQFREVFYRQILPDLKARGKLIVVISHDDRYFDAADRLIRFADGGVVLTPHATAA